MRYTTYATQDAEGVLADLETTRAGLTTREAHKRQKLYGKNTISADAVRWYHVLLRQFASPFIYLLGGAAVIALALGERVDAAIILLFVVINATLGFYQDYRSERTAQLLKKYVTHRARVLRDGDEELLENSELVPGDIIQLEPGDLIPADVRFLTAHGVQADESVLTGESAPAHKAAVPAPRPVRSVTDAATIGFGGTTIVSGTALAVVIDTGHAMVMGDIARLTIETKRVSAFDKEMAKVSGFVLRLILIALVVVFTMHLALDETGIGELILFAAALAVSEIPEALPVVISFAMAHGARRLARENVVVKRLSAIEDLGSIEVLCTDKTGTITENVLRVTEVFSDDKHETVRWAVLANADAAEIEEPKNSFDRALVEALTDRERSRLAAYERVGEHPFDPLRRKNSVLVAHDGACTLIVRGATESILPAAGVTDEQRAAYQNWVALMGERGYRTIAIAIKRLTRCDSYSPEEEESGLTVIGIVAFEDPIKKSTFEAVAHAKKLGIQVKILTGDGPEVAHEVATRINLIGYAEPVMTGEELELLSADDQLEAVRRCHVFARVSPRQKHTIIELIQEHRLVGFLGEGINDAPALKVANVALVVHGAADIAQEAADIILLNKSLSVIINGIREGRRVFANTIKYVRLTLAANFGNFVAIAVSSLMIPYLPLLPAQILLINLLSDFPLIAIATDHVNPDDLQSPQSYSTKDLTLFSISIGMVNALFDLTIFGLYAGLGAATLQTNWFIGTVLTELAFIFSLRTRGPFWKSRRPSRELVLLSIAGAVATVALPFTRLGTDFFRFRVPDQGHLAVIIALAIGFTILGEIVKLMYYRVWKTENSGR